MKKCIRLSGRVQRILCLSVCLLLVAGDTPESAVDKVEEGLQHFRNDEFSLAESAFSAALTIAPENAVILYDKGCVLLASGDRDQARTLFRSASLSKDMRLANRSQYNLGMLEATEARETLGDDPASAEDDLRVTAVESMQLAIRHYRNVLRTAPGHEDARHNLELIRIYMKHLQSQWDERDRQKARDEKDLLQFLKMIEARQFQLRTATASLSGQPTSAFLRKTAYESADALRTLSEEVPTLKGKISQELQQQAGQAAGSAQGGQSDQLQQAEEILHGLADRISDGLESAADELENGDPDASVETQTRGLQSSDDLYNSIAPYQELLRRSLERQSAILPEGQDPPVKDEDDAADTTADSGSESRSEDQRPVGDDARLVDLPPNVENDEEIQRRISGWTRSLQARAQRELPTFEQQLKQLPVPDEAPRDPAVSADEMSEEELAAGKKADDARRQYEQLEGLVESMKLAVEKGPQLVEESDAASEALHGLAQQEAENHQSQVLRILEEIAEPLKSDDQNENQQQDEQQQDQQDSEDENQQDQNQDQDDNQEEQKSPEQNKEQQEERPGRQSAESILRQAAEREKQHREDQKKIRALIQQGIKVDRDW